MDQQQINSLYKQSEQLIDAMVKKMLHKNISIDKEELMSEANLIFCECADKFNKKNGEFLQLLSTTLYFRLFMKCRELSGEKRISTRHLTKWERRELLLDNVDMNTMIKDSLVYEWQEKNSVNDLIEASIANMSNDAQEMVSVIFSPPKEMAKILEDKQDSTWKRITKKDLLKYFQDLGWKRKRILCSFREIKTGLHEVWV